MKLRVTSIVKLRFAQPQHLFGNLKLTVLRLGPNAGTINLSRKIKFAFPKDS